MKAKRPDRIQFTTTLKKEIIVKAKQIALSKDMCANDLIEIALQDLFDKEKKVV